MHPLCRNVTVPLDSFNCFAFFQIAVDFCDFLLVDLIKINEQEMDTNVQIYSISIRFIRVVNILCMNGRTSLQMIVGQ